MRNLSCFNLAVLLASFFVHTSAAAFAAQLQQLSADAAGEGDANAGAHDASCHASLWKKVQWLPPSYLKLLLAGLTATCLTDAKASAANLRAIAKLQL
jgi:hypothetical protein